jgi:hypothetical protein
MLTMQPLSPFLSVASRQSSAARHLAHSQKPHTAGELSSVADIVNSVEFTVSGHSWLTLVVVSSPRASWCMLSMRIGGHLAPAEQPRSLPPARALAPDRSEAALNHLGGGEWSALSRERPVSPSHTETQSTRPPGWQSSSCRSV